MKFSAALSNLYKPLTACLTHSGLALLGACLLLLLLCPEGHSQVSTATLVIAVEDQAGALVPDATITVLHTATGIARTVQSNDEGLATATALQPGVYDLSVEKPGFKKAVQQGLVLTVNQRARQTIVLEVGEVTESVTVEAGVPLVNTQNAELSEVVDERRVIELPLNGRNFMEFATLTTGITDGGGSNAKNAFYSGYKAYGPSAAGAPTQYNNYQLDGVNNGDEFWRSYNVSPSVDAVQEFRVQVGQYPAEFGGGGGAVVNVITKSGTNNFHGVLFEFLRNDKLDAKNFFGTSKAPLRRNQFGGSLGGPIKKDKTFFFANYDGTRERRGVTKTGFVPTDAMKTGDLSGLGKSIIDPLTRQPFPGNIIPTNRIDSISKGLMAYYPALNNPANRQQNYAANPASSLDSNSVVARLDHQWNSNNLITGRYTIEDIDRVLPGTFPLVGGQLSPNQYQNVSVGWNSTISPRFLNEVRYGYNRVRIVNTGQNTGSSISQDLGMFFAAKDDLGKGFPESIGISNSLVSPLSESNPFNSSTNSHQFLDNLTYLRGKHTFKTGADLRWTDAFVVLATHANGAYTFDGLYTGDGFGDFLLGAPSRMLIQAVPNANADYSQKTVAFYFLDEWKVTPKLSLNVGIRYEFAQFPIEKNGSNSIFDPNLVKGNVRGGLAYPKQNTRAKDFYTNQRPDLPYRLLDREAINLSDKNNFAPRLGIAYSPNGKTTIRLGYGWYYGQTELMDLINDSLSNPPSAQWPTFIGNSGVPNLNYNGDRSIDPNDYLKNVTFGALATLTEQFVQPYIQQWNASISQVLANDYVFEATYFGTKTTHVEASHDINWSPPAATPLIDRVPFPKWGRVFGFVWDGNARYQSMQLAARKQYSNGLNFRASYTYATSYSNNGARLVSGTIGLIQDPSTRRVTEDGPTSDDIRHRLSVDYLYDIPLARAFGNPKGFAGKLLEGWRVSGITTASTGLPLFMNIAAANCNSSFFNRCRPDLVGSPDLGGSGVDRPAFDVNAFDWPLNTAKHPAQTPRFGNAPVNLLRGNGLQVWDMAVLKRTQISEAKLIEFRWELFNTWNHPLFGNPNGNPLSPTFGRTLGTAGTPKDSRSMQFGLKFYF